MIKIDYLNYDENVDHLVIYKANEKIVSNIDAGLAIFSLNKAKEIVGIEFMGAHKRFQIPKEVLTHLGGCMVQVQYRPADNILIVNIALQHKKETLPFIYSSNLDLGKVAFNERFACST